MARRDLTKLLKRRGPKRDIRARRVTRTGDSVTTAGGEVKGSLPRGHRSRYSRRPGVQMLPPRQRGRAARSPYSTHAVPQCLSRSRGPQTRNTPVKAKIEFGLFKAGYFFW